MNGEYEIVVKVNRLGKSLDGAVISAKRQVPTGCSFRHLCAPLISSQMDDKGPYA